MRLTFIRESVEVVVPANSPTESLQPVAVSNVLSGAKMDIQPLAGDDFQSLVTVLPSVIRGPEDRLRIKGRGPTHGALQLSSASLNDPSTGDIALEPPSGAWNRSKCCRTRLPPNTAGSRRASHRCGPSAAPATGSSNRTIWCRGSGGFAFVNKFEPRLSISGPLKRDRLFLGQYLQYRYAQTPVKSLPGESSTRSGEPRLVHPARCRVVAASRLDRRRHLLSLARSPMRRSQPSDRRKRHRHSRSQAFRRGCVDRLILSAYSVLESTRAVRTFESIRRRRGDSRWCTRRRARPAISSTARNATSELAGRRGLDVLEKRLARSACVQTRPRLSTLQV